MRVRTQTRCGVGWAGQHGFTVSELLVALCVAAVLMGMILAALEAWMLPDWRVREGAAGVASTLQAARTRAIMDRTSMSVPFDLLRGRYTTLAETVSTGVALEEDELGQLRKVVTLPKDVVFARPDSGDAVTLVPPSTSDKAALFNAKGLLLSTSTPGLVCVGNTSRGIYRRITVNIVGTVRVERWNGQEWVRA